MCAASVSSSAAVRGRVSSWRRRQIAEYGRAEVLATASARSVIIRSTASSSRRYRVGRGRLIPADIGQPPSERSMRPIGARSPLPSGIRHWSATASSSRRTQHWPRHHRRLVAAHRFATLLVAGAQMFCWATRRLGFYSRRARLRRALRRKSGARRVRRLSRLTPAMASAMVRGGMWLAEIGSVNWGAGCRLVFHKAREAPRVSGGLTPTTRRR
jgi:hypothetical protein